MSKSNDRCAREGCGAPRREHPWRAAQETGQLHAFVDPSSAGKVETAEQMRVRLGWPPLSEAQERANLEYNLTAIGVAMVDDAIAALETK